MKALIPAAALALVSCTGTTAPNANLGVRSGNVCGYYSGSKSGSGSGAQDVIRERRCFSTRAACNAWLRDAQSRAPGTFFRRPCR